MRKATQFVKAGDNVKCTACSHYCVIPVGRTGVCGVRKNIGGSLFLLVYGRAASANVDPIEKKPLFHFLPGTEIFSIGTLGCNFGCDFCQNYEISQPPREIRNKPDMDELFSGLMKSCHSLGPEKIVEYANENRIPSIAYTYNEPAVFFEYAYDTAKLAAKCGIKNVFVSNGYESKESLKKIRPYLNAINIDLKSFSDGFYRKFCKARLEPVLRSIRAVWKMGIWLEVTTLVIPGKSDSDEELGQIAEFLAGIDKNIPWHVSAFFPHYKMTDVPPTKAGALRKACEIGKEAGLNYVYVGNVYDPEKESTFCPGCGEKIVSRSGFRVMDIRIKGGRCGNCGEKISGVFE